MREMWILRKEIKKETTYILIFYLIVVFTTIKITTLYANNSGLFIVFLILPITLCFEILMHKKTWYLGIILILSSVLLSELIAAFFVPFTLITISVYLYNGSTLEQFLNKIGFVRTERMPYMIGKSIFWLLMVVVVIGLGTVALTTLGIDDRKAVIEKVRGFSVPLIVVGASLSPVAEELLFRGVLLNKCGVLVSSLLFAISHITYGSINMVVNASLAGIVLCKARETEKTLLIPIIVHAAFNIMSIIAIYHL